jgi:4'-phosphopantetheinyl transferase EntD
VIKEILSSAIAGVDTFCDRPDVTLFPEEEAQLGKAVDKRRREFTAGRGCARDALAALGVAPAPIARGAGGAPGWPAGTVGSITHCAGYAAAAAARTRDVLAVGVDAEPDQPLPDRVLGAVTSAAERDRLGDLAARAPGPCWDRLLFSAKESVYKAWFPLTGRWLGFADASIAISPADGTFTARLLVPGPLAGGTRLDGFSGRWLARDGLLLTAITVPRR